MEISLPFVAGRAGVDEAGRGPIAGPLVVAAVVIPEGFDVTGFMDSKRLTAAQREVAFGRIVQGLRHEILIVSPEQVDELNILRATLGAMKESVERLGVEVAVIDGNTVPQGMNCPADYLVKGDSKDAAIAAASILAKVTRDREMIGYSKVYPGYGFELNKGYGIDAIAKLRELGPTPIHRRSFEPLKSMVNQPSLFLS